MSIEVSFDVSALESLVSRLRCAPGGEALIGDFVGRAEIQIARSLVQSGELDVAGQLLRRLPEPAIDAIRAEVAAVWIALGKAWARRPTDGAASQSMAAYEAASLLAPRVGLPVLADHLDRQGPGEQAIDAWRQAIAEDPGETRNYFGLARAYERAHQPEQALATWLMLVDAVPTAASWLAVAERIERLEERLPAPRANQTIRIALLGNATLDHLKSYLTVASAQAGLRPRLYQCGFDQYSQDILDAGSELYKFAPDVVVLAIHASRLFPRLHHDPTELTVSARHAEIDNGISTLRGLLRALTDRHSGLLLVHNMAAPQHPASGILDLRDEFGQALAFSEINARIAAMARTEFSSVYVVDEDRVQAEVGKVRATDARHWFTARMPWSDALLPRLVDEHLRYIRAHRGLNRKCIVLDLDNTLWGGVIGEDGLAGIQLGADAPGNAFVAFQRELERLWRKGILLAICSKNNPEDVHSVLDAHPDMVLRHKHFAASRINWQTKASNIADIARELNIGLDSLVFLDDNPVERAQVRSALPQVLTPELPADPARYRAFLAQLGVFDTLAVTAEDRQRNQLYAAQKDRDAAAARFIARGAIEDYLADLQIVVDIEPADEQNLARIAQLTTKTNQFNLTTHRYTDAQVQERLKQGWHVVGARVKDRFGDNGLTGVVMVDPRSDAWVIDTLLLSCRVMGRSVETALLAHIAEQARTAGANRLEGAYIPTAKNAPARDCYARHGFCSSEQQSTESTTWSLDLSGPLPVVPDWLTVRVRVAIA